MARRKKITRKSPAIRKEELRVHLARKPSKTSELAKAMGMHASSVGGLLNEMIDAGEVIYQGEGGRGDPYIFTLVEKNGTSTKSLVRAKKAEIVETLRVTADELPVDEAVIGACALALRKADKRGYVTVAADSPVMGLLAFAVDKHIANEQ
jgi:DNA-binding IclR family transcriptional regulator